MKKKFKVGDVVMIVGNVGCVTHFHTTGNLAIVYEIGTGGECNIKCTSLEKGWPNREIPQWHYPENLVKVGVL